MQPWFPLQHTHAGSAHASSRCSTRTLIPAAAHASSRCSTRMRIPAAAAHARKFPPLEHRRGHHSRAKCRFSPPARPALASSTQQLRRSGTALIQPQRAPQSTLQRDICRTPRSARPLCGAIMRGWACCTCAHTPNGGGGATRSLPAAAVKYTNTNTKYTCNTGQTRNTLLIVFHAASC